MNGQRIAYNSLRLFITGLMDAGKVSDESATSAMELLYALFEPYEQAETRISKPGHLHRLDAQGQPMPAGSIPTPPMLPRQPQNATPRAQGAPLGLVSTPVPSPQAQIDPTWRGVVHARGPEACGRPAYYITKKLWPRKPIDFSTIRMIPTGQPPRPGIDEQVCGSCGTPIEMFSPDYLEFTPHILTNEEITYLQYGNAPVDPELEKKNRESQRWLPDESGVDATTLIGFAQTGPILDDLNLPEDADAGVPPDSTLPEIPSLPIS